jgi:enamine deaminase RidA (YjgF/YER057c/UK114 family)
MIAGMDVAAKLAELGWKLPEPPKPVGAYLPAVRSGNLLFVSGQLPMSGGKLTAEGAVPSAASVESAQKAAGQCVVNALAIVAAELGGKWERIVRVVRIGVFVQSDGDFRDQAKVANGASELLQAIFADAGKHARAAVGAAALPLNASVEIEFIFEIR